VGSDCTLVKLEIGEFDSLLLSGSSDPQVVLNDDRYTDFIRSFDIGRFKVGEISCSPLFLAKAVLLGLRGETKNRKYIFEVL
jgi:hypothetical protein